MATNTKLPPPLGWNSYLGNCGSATVHILFQNIFEKHSFILRGINSRIFLSIVSYFKVNNILCIEEKYDERKKNPQK